MPRPKEVVSKARELFKQEYPDARWSDRPQWVKDAWFEEAQRVLDADGRYVKPWNAGLASETGAVAKQLGRLLTALGEHINENIVEPGELAEDLRELRMKIHERITAEGWRVKAKDGSGWRVLPPKRGAK